MIRISGLTVTYPDGNRALEDLSLSLGDGERVALIGANGAGKSTLLRTIVGLQPFVGGEIVVDGTVLSRKTVSAIHQRIGIVFQNPDDQLFMTRVRDDVAFGPRNRGASPEEAAAKVDDVLERLGVFHLKDRFSGHLSAGEKRICAIATVLSMEPSALLLDEPSSFLDPKSRRVLMGVLAELPHAQLIATHDLDLARRLCPRTVVLQNGRLRAQGPSDEILRDAALLESCGL